MIFPKGIIGPKFEQGDLVTFMFNGAELTVRLPKIPINTHTEDNVSPIKDYSCIDTCDWGQDDQGNRCEQLAFQSWSFEDRCSLDDIALVRLDVSLVDVSQKKEITTLLDYVVFEKMVMDGLSYSFSEDGKEHYKNIKENRFFAESINKNHLNWLMVKISYDQNRLPSPVVFLPVNSNFFVMVSLIVESLYYAGRTNPYSDTLLKQFEFDLFEDFISHMDLRYTPETIATIESLKGAVSDNK